MNVKLCEFGTIRAIYREGNKNFKLLSELKHFTQPILPDDRDSLPLKLLVETNLVFAVTKAKLKFKLQLSFYPDYVFN